MLVLLVVIMVTIKEKNNIETNITENLAINVLTGNSDVNISSCSNVAIKKKNKI